MRDVAVVRQGVAAVLAAAVMVWLLPAALFAALSAAQARPAAAQEPGYERDAVCPVPYFDDPAFVQSAHRSPVVWPEPEPYGVLFVAVDFDNVQSDVTGAQALGTELPALLEQDLERLSQGNLRVEVDTLDEVYRMPDVVSDEYLNDSERYLDDVYVAVDEDADMSRYDMVVIVPPQVEDTSTVPTTVPSYALIDVPARTPVDGVERRWAAQLGFQAYDRATVLHEILHLFGSPDLYNGSAFEGDADDGESFVGNWSVMRGPTYDFVEAASFMDLGWQLLQYGWLRLSERECAATAGTSVHRLVPLADGDGIRVVQIPVDGGRTGVLELRVPGPDDSGICDGRGGVLGYVHDINRESAEGIIEVVDATPGSIPPASSDQGNDRELCWTDVDDGAMTAETGPVDLLEGVTVEVLELADDHAVVQVTREDDYTRDPLVTDTGREMQRNPLGEDLGITPRFADFGDAMNQSWDVSQVRFRDGEANHVVLTRDDAFADALAGTALLRDGPMLLLTGTSDVEEWIVEEVQRVLPAGGRVYLLGGEQAAAPSIADIFTDLGFDVRRLAGASRVETSARIAAEAHALHPENADRVMVARAGGEGTAAWADAVTAGGFAAATGIPVILTDSRGLSGGLDPGLEGVTRATLLGGPAALSPQVAADLQALQIATDRVEGAARDATAAAISAELWDVQAGQGPFIVVNGYQDAAWATGLPAAGLSADLGAPLLVTNAGSLPPDTRRMLTTCDRGSLASVVLGVSETSKTHIAPQISNTVQDAVESLDGAC